MGRSKQDKFKDNEQRRNVIQPGKEIFDRIKGNWDKLHFKNQKPIILELACGKGEYTVGLAKVFPEKNIIGVDIKGSRIWKGSRIAENEHLLNAAFLRVQIQNLDKYFDINEIDEIWITFPDPRPKDRDERRRLTNQRFMDIYNRILKSGGWVHLKTDNQALFEYTLQLVKAIDNASDLQFTYDLYHSEFLKDQFSIQTTYEIKFLEENVTIKYLKFRLY